MSKEARAPYVVFETRAEEDRLSTIENGCYTSHDVDYAIITPPGSRDRIEKKVEEWFSQLADHKESARQGEPVRIPESWILQYETMYSSWKKGNEAPVNGTSIKMWPVLSPSQIKNLISVNIMTIEDLAGANEEALKRVGLGSRLLKQQAQAWMDSSTKTSLVADELLQLRSDNEAMLLKNKTLESNIKELTEQVSQLIAVQKKRMGA